MSERGNKRCSVSFRGNSPPATWTGRALDIVSRRQVLFPGLVTLLDEEEKVVEIKKKARARAIERQIVEMHRNN